MGGYTPVFDTVFDGTLCGQWPTLPVWLTILPLADWRGHIDMTLQAIAVRTGWPLDLLRQGIAELCKPDPYSRSKAEEGRRLIPIDPARNWGWRVVNIEVYRRKCRDANDVADGKAAERAKRYRDRHAASRAVTSPHASSSNSDSDSDSDSDRKKKPEARVSRALVLHESLPKPEWELWIEHRREKRWPCDPRTLRMQLSELAKHDRETQAEMIRRSINAGWQGIFPPRGTVNGKHPEDTGWRPTE